MDQQATIPKPLTETEAVLKDAMMIIRLMYEDMIKNDINTKSVKIAGRFLHSSQYSEWEKNLTR